MDPATMAALASVMSSIMGQMTGKKGEHGSTYGKNTLSALDEVTNAVRGGTGGQSQDITQNPLYQGGNNFLQNLYGNDQGFWNQFEAPIMRQYEEEIVPGLANRFASQGSGGSLGSTGFRNQLAREGSNLSTNLAAQRGNMQMQGLGSALNYSQQPVSNWMQQLQSILMPTQNTWQGPSSGGWADIAGSLASGASNAYLGQPNSAGQQPMNQENLQRQYPNNPGQSPMTY